MASPDNTVRLADLQRRVAHWHVLLVGNRGAAPVVARLGRELSLRCTVEDAAGRPRRRCSLVERIARQRYNAVLVAQGFTPHADSTQIAAACLRAQIPYIAVGKGRFAEIVRAMQAVLLRTTHS